MKMDVPRQTSKQILGFSTDREEIVSCLLALGKQQSHETPIVQNSAAVSKTSSSATMIADESVSNVGVPSIVVSDDDLSSTQYYLDLMHSRQKKTSCGIKTNPGKSLSVLETLMRLVLDPVFDDMITFLPDEASFVVLSPKAFSSVILPNFFSMKKFSSFVRKLECYGFEQFKLCGKIGHPAFRHDLFRKSDPELCRKIRYQPYLNNRKKHLEILSKKNNQSIKIGDYVSVQKKDEKNMEDKGPLNRQLVLEAQLRALQDEENKLTANKYTYFGRKVSSLRFQHISPDDDVIEVTRNIVGAAIDCLLVDEDHTRHLLARHSLRLRLQRNSIFPPGLLMHEILQKKSSSTLLNLSDIIEQKLGTSKALVSLEHNDNLLSILKANLISGDKMAEIREYV